MPASQTQSLRNEIQLLRNVNERINRFPLAVFIGRVAKNIGRFEAPKEGVSIDAHLLPALRSGTDMYRLRYA